MSTTEQKNELQVWANTDNPEGVTIAKHLGAEGILYRTDKLFTRADCIPLFRKVILALNPNGKVDHESKEALNQLLLIQTADLEGAMREGCHLPIRVRLLDEPLQEFLPGEKAVREVNPLIGQRGARLLIMHPEIGEMQTRAAIKAAAQLQREGANVDLGIEIPFVMHPAELKTAIDIVNNTVEKTAEETGTEGNGRIRIGAGIGTTAAVYAASQLAPLVDYFNINIEDLTQTVFAMSKEDAEAHFLGEYFGRGILPSNPFKELDTAVGKLVKETIEEGRKNNSNLEIGTYDVPPVTLQLIEFLRLAGLDYVSVSPDEVSTARQVAYALLA